MGGKREYELLKTSGGLAGEYADISEADFASPNGAAYNPPEDLLDYRRINIARTIQMLGSCPVSVETFQVTAATIRLPANTVTDLTDDAGDGRLFFLTNSGSAILTIEDYLGTVLHKVPVNSKVIIAGNTNNNWDFFVASPSPKSGVALPGFFAGTPKKATITFAVPYPDTNYSVHLTGTDGRIWSYENKTANGFVINSNSNVTPTSEVSWRTSRCQET
jgi:hypothetical protein